jgi:hypothetical protein
MRLVALSFLAVACTPAPVDPAGDPADPADPADPGVDPSGDDGTFLVATGTKDGEDVDVDCESSELAGSQDREGDDRYLTVACIDQGNFTSISLGAYTNQAMATELCEYYGLSAQVVDVATGRFWNCAVDPSAGFGMDVDQFTTEADGSITWGGTFTLTEGGLGLPVDISGSFLVNSPCNGAGC